MNKYQVDYAGAGMDGVHQYIIVDRVTLDEYIDPVGDRLAFPTEEDAWEHIDNLNEVGHNQ